MHAPKDWFENIVNTHRFDPLSGQTDFLLQFEYWHADVLIVAAHEQVLEPASAQFILVIHNCRIRGVVQ
jgi:hypothetical protein